VRDTGIGIAKKAMEKIFEKGGVGSDRDGSARVGLGLYICRRLVEIQNGRIWMESAPGVGTKVTFSLPV
jgi:signal transduction histidine kinase